VPVRILETEIWLSRSSEEVFAFFSDALNLEVLTPPWLHFRVLTPGPIVMRKGAQIDYRIRWRCLPLKWRTEISEWEPPHRFVDRQVRGPYRQWVHEHTFERHVGGTLMRDRVEYLAPLRLIEPVVHRLIVAPDVRRIFDYRTQKMQELFGPARREGSSPVSASRSGT
jgi:ligand-binding SRPBCC domain-containing protein